MEAKANYTLLGLFVIILLSALVGIAGWLLSDTTYRNYAMYYAYMNESVSGLNKDAPVKYNGVDVGYVSSISINPRNPQQVQLILKIEAEIPITESTSAKMISQGLTGLRFIELAVDDIHSPLLKRGNDKYPTINTSPSLLVRLDQTASNILKDFDNISDSVSTFLDDGTTLAMRNSLTHLETITEALAQHIDTMTASLQDAQVIFRNSANVSQQFPDLVELMQATFKQVQNMSEQLQQAATDIAFTAKQSGSAVQQVNDQVMPQMANVMLTMNEIGEQFSEFMQKLDQQPSSILRGRQPAKRGPGE